MSRETVAAYYEEDLYEYVLRPLQFGAAWRHAPAALNSRASVRVAPEARRGLRIEVRVSVYHIRHSR